MANTKTISQKLIPITRETWLLQPLAVTMMRHDYSLIQNKILLSIVEKLQEALRIILSSGLSVRQLNMFNTEIGEKPGINLSIPLSQFGITKYHYPELKQALKLLVTIPVEIPYKSPDGKKFKKLTNLCDAYIPEGKYQKNVVINIDEDVAERILSFEFGWHRLGKEIVLNCRNKYTQRIYMFISSWKDKGETTISAHDFRQMLRLENKYPNFRQFHQRVLAPAMAELECMAKNGFSDCYFVYNKVYVGKKHTGEPNQLHFVILKSPTIETKEKEEFLLSKRRQFIDLLTRHYGQSLEKASQLASLLTAENSNATFYKLDKLYTYIRENASTVKNPNVYVYKSLENFLTNKDEI